MNLRTSFLAVALAGALLFAAGCSGQGPDVVDPNSTLREQVSFFAMGHDTTSDLARYSELTGKFVLNEYATANGGPLFKDIDAIYEEGGRLFLHHRDFGDISVLELATRRKIGTIEGFPAKGDGRMCAMAFSNFSQAWVVCYGSKNLFQVDAQNNVIADTIALPANPTHVGAVDTLVFVCMEQPDGTGLVGILKSNTGGVFNFEKTFAVSSPVIFSAPTADHADYLLVTAGNATAKPKVYYISTSSLESDAELEIDEQPLTNFIGSEPTFASYTSKYDLLYLAFPDAVLQIPYNTSPTQWVMGNYPVIAADPATDLLYAYAPDSLVVKRQTTDGVDIGDLATPRDVRAIFFIGANRIP